MKEKNPNKIHKISLRLTEEEYTKIERKWKASMCMHFSVYVRNVLFGRPIVMTHRNRSLDDFMEEAIRLKKELHAIHETFASTLEKRSTIQLDAEFENWLISYHLDRELLMNKIDDVKGLLQKVAESWLR